MMAAAVIFLGILVIYFSWGFYRNVDWRQPPESTPDIKALHKREAEILHIQDFLEAARAEGKVTQGLVDEFNRFCENEVAALRQSADRQASPKR